MSGARVVSRSLPDRARLGAPQAAPHRLKNVAMHPPATGRDWIALTPEPLPLDAASMWATTPGAGAVVSFAGVVRDHAEGRSGVRAMTYEAYEEPAVRRLSELVVAERHRWPAVEGVALLHRVGELELSEASVLVVVSAPHRDAA